MPESRGRKSKPGQAARDRARRARQAQRDNEWVAMQFGAVGDLSIEEDCELVRQTTHDRVIEETARYRSSGVAWYTIKATDMEQCRAFIGNAGAATPEMQKARDELIEFLEANPAGGLIVATVRCLRGQDKNKAHLS